MPLLHSSHPHSGGGRFTTGSQISPDPNFPEEVSLAPCHCRTTGHVPAGGSQIASGSLISSGQFLWLPASPCSWISIPVPLIRRSRRFHCDSFLRDLPMGPCSQHYFWIHLRRSSVGRRLFSPGTPYWLPSICLAWFSFLLGCYRNGPYVTVSSKKHIEIIIILLSLSLDFSVFSSSLSLSVCPSYSHTTASESSEITQFRISVGTTYWGFSCCVNVSYAVGHDQASGGPLLWVLIVLWCEEQLVFVLDSNLIKIWKVSFIFETCS
jgi:hypothetical protein